MTHATREELRLLCSNEKTKRWSVKQDVDGEYIITSDQGYIIARIYGGGEPFEEAKGNAYLIAAAPNLMRALRDLVAAATPGTSFSRKCLAVNAAYAAIGLATDSTQEGLCGGPAVVEG